MTAVVSVILIGITLVFFTAPVQAFSSEFGVDLLDPNPGANSDISLVFDQPNAGESAFKKITVTVPAGFEFTSSTELGQFEKIGQGTFDAGSGVYNTLVSLYSDQTLGPGQKAHWVLVFDDARLPQIDVFLTGNSTTGHTFVIEFPPSVLPLPTPIFWPLNILGVSNESPNTIVRNPGIAGTYQWRVEFQSERNEIVLRETDVVVKIHEQKVVGEGERSEQPTGSQSRLIGENEQGNLDQSQTGNVADFAAIDNLSTPSSTIIPESRPKSKISRVFSWKTIGLALGGAVFGFLVFRFGRRVSRFRH